MSYDILMWISHVPCAEYLGPQWSPVKVAWWWGEVMPPCQKLRQPIFYTVKSQTWDRNSLCSNNHRQEPNATQNTESWLSFTIQIWIPHLSEEGGSHPLLLWLLQGITDRISGWRLMWEVTSLSSHFLHLRQSRHVPPHSSYHKCIFQLLFIVYFTKNWKSLQWTVWTFLKWRLGTRLLLTNYKSQPWNKETIISCTRLLKH